MIADLTPEQAILLGVLGSDPHTQHSCFGFNPHLFCLPALDKHCRQPGACSLFTSPGDPSVIKVGWVSVPLGLELMSSCKEQRPRGLTSLHLQECWVLCWVSLDRQDSSLSSDRLGPQEGSLGIHYHIQVKSTGSVGWGGTLLSV